MYLFFFSGESSWLLSDWQRSIFSVVDVAGWHKLLLSCFPVVQSLSGLQLYFPNSPIAIVWGVTSVLPGLWKAGMRQGSYSCCFGFLLACCAGCCVRFFCIFFLGTTQSFTGGKRQYNDNDSEDSGFLILYCHSESMFLKSTVSEATFSFPIFSKAAKISTPLMDHFLNIFLGIISGGPV